MRTETIIPGWSVKPSSSSLVSTDALVKWILCFSEGLQGNSEVWSEKLSSNSWVLSHIPALLRNVQLSCISRSALAWIVWVCGWTRCRAPSCSCSSGFSLFVFEEWNSTGGGIATGSPFIIISWHRENCVQAKHLGKKNKASDGALIPVFGIILNFNKASQELFIELFSWRNFLCVYIQKTEFSKIILLWDLFRTKKGRVMPLLHPKVHQEGGNDSHWVTSGWDQRHTTNTSEFSTVEFYWC